MTSPEDLSRLAADVALLGDVATLVNNAGAARAVSLHDTTPEIWRKDNALNLEAPFLCFRAFEEPLKRTQGALVNVASVNGMSVFGHPAYSAAKAGLIHLTKLIAVEYGKFGIRSTPLPLALFEHRHGKRGRPTIRKSSKRRSTGIRCAAS